MSNTIIVREVGKEAVEEQLCIFNKAFRTNASLDGWMHKHYMNPFGYSKAFLALDGTRVVGINMFMPIRYIYKGQMINAGQSCESGIDPEYRRRGIFSKVILFAERTLADNGYDVVVGYPNRDTSFPGFLKSGWRHVSSIHNMFIMRNLSKIILAKFHISLPTYINTVTNLKLMKIKQNANRTENLSLNVVESLPFTDEEYLKMSEREYISFHVNRDIIKWKFAGSKYRFYVVCEEKIIIAGFVVAYGDTHDGLRNANVVSLFRNTDDTQKFSSAFSVLLLHLWDKADYINTWRSNSQLKKTIAEKNGFRTRNTVFQPFIIKVLTRDTDRFAALSNATRWDPQNIELDNI